MEKWIHWLDPQRSAECEGTEREPPVGPVVMEAKEVWREFADNQVAAELRFAGASFALTGTVDHVDRDERGRIRVHLAVDTYHTLRVRFPEEARDEIIRLRRGDRVSCPVRVLDVDSGLVELGAVGR
jgi:hypothetical protein